MDGDLTSLVCGSIDGNEDAWNELVRRYAGLVTAVVRRYRITDADASSGLDLIRTVKADPSLASIPTMLVSDLSQAQADAVSLGALPGFGKSAVRHPKTLAQLEAALGRADG